jgi:glycosyltransferase involved in cell wall biosynthesis
VKRAPHILFTSTFRASFVQQDVLLLGSNFPLTVVVASGMKAVSRYFAAIRNATITYTWFASIYSAILVLLTTLFRKRSVIVLGGIDVADIRELGYGIWNSRWRAPIVRYAIMHADAVIAVDMFLKLEAMRLAHYDGGNISVVPTGYDKDVWTPSGVKREMVLMVASCPDASRIKIKGVDFFLDVARALPNIDFVLVGPSDSVLQTFRVPENVRSYTFLPPHELLLMYQEAKVYAQLSMREGLPNSLCEAMLCECVPVGTRNGGIPTAIGEVGYLCEYGNIADAVRQIKAALHAAPECGIAARTRIIDHFSVERRRQALKDVIERLSA